jgi:hypothetical protein
VRVQVPDLQGPEALQPRQPVGDAFIRPPAQDQNNDLANLASSLGGFSQALNGLGQVLQRGENRAPKEDPREAYGRRWLMEYGHTEEGRKALVEGRAPYQSYTPIFQLYAKSFGERDGARAVEEFNADLKAGRIPLTREDGQEISVDEILSGVVTTRMDRAGGLERSESYVKGFYEKFTSARDAAQAAFVERRAAQLRTATQGITQNDQDRLLAAAGNTETSDDDLRAGLLGMKAGARRFGVNPPDFDQVLIGRLKESAGKSPEAVLRLLDLDRGKGVDGQPIGALKDNPRLYEEVIKIREAARAELGKRWEITNRETAVKEAADLAARGDGSFSQVVDRQYVNPYDPRGERKTLSADSIRDEALTLQATRARTAAVRQGLSPAAAEEDVFRTEQRLYIANNRSNPRWSAALNEATTVLSNPAALSNPDAMGRVRGAIDLYKRLDAVSPGYVQATLGLSDKARSFFDQYQLLEQAGIPPEEAVRRTADWANGNKVELTPEARTKIKTAVGKIEQAGFWGWLPGTAYPGVPSYREEVVRLATSLATMKDQKPEDAVATAEKMVSSRMVFVNGRGIYGHPLVTQQNLPQYQARLAEIWAEKSNGAEMVGEDGAKISSASLLSIRPIGRNSSIFEVVTKEGTPVTTWDGQKWERLRLDHKDILRLDREEKQRQVQKIQTDQANAVDQAIINSTPRRGVAASPAARSAAQARIEARRGPAPAAPEISPIFGVTP